MARRKIYKPWIKLHIRLLDNEDVADLSDSSKWKFIECLLLAGEERNRAIESGTEQEDGFLPTMKRMAHVLKTTQQALQDDLSRLAMAGLMELREHPDGGERWYVTHFIKWQEGTPDAERQRFSRSTRKNEEERERIRGRIIDEQFSSQPSHKIVTEAKAPVSSPHIVYSLPTDRTPAGFRSQQGYQPPAAPPPPDEKKPDPAIGDMTNAITEVTGIAAKLNKEVFELAGVLVELGYSAAQVRRAYSKSPTPGAWHWYAEYWKGKRGDRPSLKDIRETIAAATEVKQVAKKLRPIDIVLGGAS